MRERYFVKSRLAKGKKINGPNKIGDMTNILDKNNHKIRLGDRVKYGQYEGYVLYNKESRNIELMLDYSMWYGLDKYNVESYGKSVLLRKDNGGKNELLILEEIYG